MKTFLAVDIGASSGRHILGFLNGGELTTKEIYRFENGFYEKDGELFWDIDRLCREVTAGLAECKRLGFSPESVAIDTWGVDYVLLGSDGEKLCDPHCYRDNHTLGVVDEVEKTVPFDELYAHTGIQRLTFNSVYRLMCDKKSGLLSSAETFLSIPDYIVYRLTGNIFCEYTDATTGSLVSVATGEYDSDIIGALGYPQKIFLPLSKPGTDAGLLKPEVAREVGFDCEVVLAASHDTASAVAACPLPKKNGVYISSGTWSLIGSELLSPVTGPSARDAGFTNEGGYGGTFRFLKNCTGMWMFQEIRKSLNKRYSYDELMYMAEESGEDFSEIDVNDPSLLAPDDMLSAVQALCGGGNKSLGHTLNSVYRSLADSYRVTVENIASVTGIVPAGINIVGGGSVDEYLDKLTAEYTGLPVTAGPVEATALGNIAVQAMARDKSLTLTEMRRIIAASFNTRVFNP